MTDMHVALDDVGILYASVICHSGWLKLLDSKARKPLATVPHEKAKPDDEQRPLLPLLLRLLHDREGGHGPPGPTDQGGFR